MQQPFLPHPRLIRFAVQRLRLSMAGFSPSASPGIERFGGWSADLGPLGRESVIYSFGVGTDIEWELEIIRRTGATVHAFDPTPRSASWMAGQRLPPELLFHPVGISDKDGELMLYPPRRPNNPHFSRDRMKHNRNESDALRCPVERLRTIMRRLGHQRLDLLKVDIEGSEFDCIPDVLSSGVEIDQILVEVHYRNPGRSMRDGVALLSSLRDAGFACTDISRTACEFSFAHQRILGTASRSARQDAT